MAIVTRLEECRAESIARTQESAQINDRLSLLNSEHEAITNEIKKAEEKVCLTGLLNRIVSTDHSHFFYSISDYNSYMAQYRLCWNVSRARLRSSISSGMNIVIFAMILIVI